MVPQGMPSERSFILSFTKRAPMLRPAPRHFLYCNPVRSPRNFMTDSLRLLRWQCHARPRCGGHRARASSASRTKSSSAIPTSRKVALIGIPSRGVEIAQRLAALHRAVRRHGRSKPASIDVSMHRDDLHTGAAASGPCSRRNCRTTLDDMTIILADDVLFSGRTCRAAMDAISSFGRPGPHPVRGADRSRPSRAADPRGLRRQESSDRLRRSASLSGFRDIDGVPDAVWIEQT